jgi:hypothetical protein
LNPSTYWQAAQNFLAAVALVQQNHAVVSSTVLILKQTNPIESILAPWQELLSPLEDIGIYAITNKQTLSKYQKKSML